MKRATILFSLLCVVCSLAYAGKKHEIQLALKTGDTFKLKQITEMHMKQEIMGQSQNVETDISALMNFEVTSKESDGYWLKMTFGDYTMDLTSAMFNMHYNSQDTASEEDVFAKIMNEVVKLTLKMKVSPSGEILQFDGLEEQIDDLVSRLDYPDNVKDQLKAQFTKSFGDDAWKGNMESLFKIYPTQKVAENDEWQSGYTITSMLDAKVESTYKLEEVKGNVITITGNGNLSTQSEEPMVLNGVPATMDLKGSQTSTYQLSSDTGWIKEATIKSDISGSISLDLTSQGMDKIDVPVSYDMTNKYIAVE